ncbi:MAG: hypothetical protein ACFFD4_06860 [Candidatus Odinarchaeota archaeon]
MKTISEYLERLKLEVSWLSKTRNDTAAEDYKNHLEAKYAEFKAKRTGRGPEELLEEEFVKGLENPLVIADSLVEEPRGTTAYRFRRKTGQVTMFLTSIQENYARSRLNMPFIEGVLFFGWLLAIMFLNICLLIVAINSNVWKLFRPQDQTAVHIAFLFIHFAVLYSCLFGGTLVLVAKRGLKRAAATAFHGVTLLLLLHLLPRRQTIDYFIHETWSSTAFLSTHDYWNPEHGLDVKKYRTLEETVISWLGYDFKVVIDALIVMLVFVLMARILLAVKDWTGKKPWKKIRARAVQVLVVSITITVIFAVSFVTQELVVIPDTDVPAPDETQLVYYFIFSNYIGTSHLDRSITVPFLNGSLPGQSPLLLFQFSKRAPSSLTEQSVYTVHGQPLTSTTRLFGMFYLPDTLDGKNWTEIVENDVSALDIFQGFTLYADLEDSTIQHGTSTVSYGEEVVITIPVRTVVAVSDANQNIRYRLHFDSKTGWLMKAYIQQPFETSAGDTYGSLEIRRLFTLPMQPEDLKSYITAYNAGGAAIFAFFGLVNLVLLVPQVRAVVRNREKRMKSTVD